MALNKTGQCEIIATNEEKVNCPKCGMPYWKSVGECPYCQQTDSDKHN